MPPGHGQLRLWGQLGDEWYALIEWLAQVHDYRLHGGEHRGAIFCTAWIAAEHVGKVAGEGYAGVPRINLHGDSQYWPTRLRVGVSTPDDYYLGLLDGGQISPPPGVQWLEGHGSMYG